MNPVIVLFAASVLWGCTWWPLKQLAQLGVTGLPQILVAYGSAALLLLPLLFVQYRRWRGEARLVAGIFLLGGAANLAFAYALIHGEVVRVMVLFYLLPVWGVLGGRFFLGERIDGQRALAVALALSGAVLILGGPDVLGAPPSWIDLIAIASGFFFAMNNLCFRASQAAPVPAKVAAMFLGCAVFALLLLAGGVQAMPAGIPAFTWLLVIAAGLMLLTATAGSQYGVTHLEAGRSSVIIIMELVTAVITAAWWAGESMSGMEWLGGALILGAALLEAWRPTPPPVQAPSS
ncbi:MAG: DMT family transporter [Pseudomonadota bacterium]